MPYSRKEIIHILRSAAFQRATSGGLPASPLYEEAGRATRSIFGSTVYQRGVVEFSSHCDINCLFCGLRHANTRLQRYALSCNEILHAVDYAVCKGMGTIVLQCGQSHSLSPDFIAGVITAIKIRHDVAITLSLGEHHSDAYRLWRDSGADRYLLKVETTDETLHARLRPGQTAASRLKHLDTLRRLGFETGSGIISGLPGMTPDILADDLIRLSTMGLEMLAVGPFIPHPQTPIGSSMSGGLAETLLSTAFLRLMNKGANIPATSALDALSPDGRVMALRAGANVVMPSFTPDRVRATYSIYPGKNHASTSSNDTVTTLQQRVHDAGFTLSTTTGPSKAGMFASLPTALSTAL